MATFCGIDPGSLKTPAYVAWLKDRDFLLDLYVPSQEHPLPTIPTWAEGRIYIAIDAPQGLPRKGEKVRKADKDANTPTRVLPRTRSELKDWKLFKGLIEVGVRDFSRKSCLWDREARCILG